MNWAHKEVPSHAELPFITSCTLQTLGGCYTRHCRPHKRTALLSGVRKERMKRLAGLLASTLHTSQFWQLLAGPHAAQRPPSLRQRNEVCVLPGPQPVMLLMQDCTVSAMSACVLAVGCPSQPPPSCAPSKTGSMPASSTQQPRPAAAHCGLRIDATR